MISNTHGRLIVVSNRLPALLRTTGSGWRSEKSAGGLATAMNPILETRGGLWIGWPGDSAHIGDPQRQHILNKWKALERLVAVEIPPETADHFYEGYSNQTLWPLFHHFPSRLTFDPKGWQSYYSANKLFCDEVVRQHREGDLIWVHDYQLMLLPRLLREALPEAAIGFFLHIPFPSSEVFRILPEREELLEGLLGADLIGFHTYSHLQHFRNSLKRVLGRESRLDEVESGGRKVRLEALPIGIAPAQFADCLHSRESQQRLDEFRARYQGRQILLAVDRMDYTKGIPERLRTYRRLLERNPSLRGKIVLLQVAVPSRERISTYETLRRQVNELVGDINGHFATPNWTPVVYIRRGISRSELVALYALADVAWVSPLRDGMNLVAKEFVACKESPDGVLVLSEFAGAAEEMGEALLVNPNDQERTSVVIENALSMPREEQRHRMQALQDHVNRNDVFAWSDQFLNTLQNAAASRGNSPSDWPAPLNGSLLLDDYRAAGRRLLLLDYDGTLIEYHDRPEKASPTTDLIALLKTLACMEGNSVLIVSGRSRAELEQWFGGIQGLWLAAEHGALFRRPGADQWEPLRQEHPGRLLERVRPVLQHFAARTHGSFVEVKEFSLVWHYRLAESRHCEWLADEVVAMLEDMLAETDLRAIRGHKIVEIRPGWLHKGALARRFLELTGPGEFQLAMGNDRTDEDLFDALGATAWTVHVGIGRSHARFGLPGPADAISLLRKMGTPQERD